MALGARFHDVLAVTAGTTLGMMVSDGIAVYAGDRLAAKVNMTWVRRATAILFVGFGIGALWPIISSY